LGYDGIWSAETDHDPFLPLALAARHTKTALLGTSIAVAFARNPMNLAYLGNDLQSLSQGRFVLGLGSQIRAHIAKRFSMPWSHPAPRMREMIQAIRGIWAAWETGERLSFRGDFYTHTLMTPFFSPGPNKYGTPRIFLAAVGPRMTEVAGDVADGMLVHGFTTERYLREVTLPAVERGLARSGRTRADFELSYPAFIVTADNEQDMAQAAAACKKQIAFYASTPAYLPVLERHGWEELGDELNRLSKTGDPDRWDRMGGLVDDEVLHAFAVVAQPSDVSAALHARFGGVVDRVSFSRPFGLDARRMADVVGALKNV
ncbi:MAG: LLM class F420-dependent oxidoreductase, partial [Streptosporangiales bacterium]